MNKDGLLSILLAIDEEAYLASPEPGFRSQVVIVEGAAFLLHDITPRKATHDLDILMADSLVRQILASYPNANSAVAAYLDHLPYNFEDRLVAIELETRAIDYFTPSTEDLVVMKLYAERPHDIQDIDGAAHSGRIDWELLDHLVHDPEEAKASALSKRRFEEMPGAYERFCERWRQ